MHGRWRSSSPAIRPWRGSATPAWRSSPYRALARAATCRKGAGSVFTFGLKGGYEAGIKARRVGRAVVAPRQRRRHPQPDHPSRLDDAPPADGRAARGGRRRQRRDPALGGHRDRRGPDRGPGAGAGASGLARTGRPRIGGRAGTGRGRELGSVGVPQRERRRGVICATCASARLVSPLSGPSVRRNTSAT